MAGEQLECSDDACESEAHAFMCSNVFLVSFAHKKLAQDSEKILKEIDADKVGESRYTL